LCNARYSHAASTGSLSAVTFNQVDIGAQYFQGSAPYTGIILPAAGIYEFRLSGWRCGVGDGTVKVTNTRSGTPVYNQAWVTTNTDCTDFHDHFLIPNCLANDVITMQMDENNSGTPVTSITDATVQSQGNLIVIYWAQYGV
jgi:hypothetical protein